MVWYGHSLSPLQFPELHAMIMRRFSSNGDVDRAWQYVMEVRAKDSLRLLSLSPANCYAEGVALISIMSKPVWIKTSPVFLFNSKPFHTLC